MASNRMIFTEVYREKQPVMEDSGIHGYFDFRGIKVSLLGGQNGVVPIAVHKDSEDVEKHTLMNHKDEFKKELQKSGVKEALLQPSTEAVREYYIKAFGDDQYFIILNR